VKGLAYPPRRGLFSFFKDCNMNDDLLDKGQRDRSHISMGQPHEVQYWTRHLGVSKEELQRTVDKVGNSAAAVRKELGLLGEKHK
jgi:3-oxoacyl-[acyl-carrier-protein] synthase III